MDVGAPLVADSEATGAGEPGQGAFDHPAVAAEPVRALDAVARDARGDGALTALGSASSVVVRLVRTELAGSASRAPAAPTHARHGVEPSVEPSVERGRGRRAVAPARAARASTPSGVPRARAGRWRLRSPAGRALSGSGRSSRAASPVVAGAPFRRDRRAARSSPGSARAHPPRPAARAAPRCRSPGTPASRRSRSRHRPVVPARPNASRGRRSRPMPEPSRQRDALQALRGASVTSPRAPTLRPRGLGAPHWRHRRPRLVARKRLGHDPQRSTPI